MTRKPLVQSSYRVFISHSKMDRWVARQMSNLIEQKGRVHGIKTFLDEKDIESGESIHESIRNNIRGCNELLVLLSRNSIERPWVLIEMGAAWVLRKRIIAIIDKVTPEEMPDIITPYKAVDINSFDEYLQDLLKRAQRLQR